MTTLQMSKLILTKSKGNTRAHPTVTGEQGLEVPKCHVVPEKHISNETPRRFLGSLSAVGTFC